MKDFVTIFASEVPVFTEGSGSTPLLVVGPADLFRKNNMFSEKMGELFTIYYVDLFSDCITLEESTIQNLTMNDFVNVIESIRTQLKLPEIALFGHSALGVLAYEYTLRYPQYSLYLLLVATSPIWTQDKQINSMEFFKKNASEDRTTLYYSDQDSLSQDQSSDPQTKFVNSYFAKRAWFFREPESTIPKDMWNNISHYMPLVSQYFNLIQNYNMKTKPTKVPVFLAMGMYDTSIPFYLWTEDMKNVIQKPHYYIFENSAHYPMIEEPDLFCDAVESFITDGILEAKSTFTMKPM